MREVRRPMHSASLSAAYTFYQGRAQLFGEVIYNGAMDDLEFINATPQTRVTLTDYVLVNIGGSFKVNETVEVYGRVENLLDERYEEVFGYNTQGRAAFAGVKARF
jgi:vitamin B12 transporter